MRGICLSMGLLLVTFLPALAGSSPPQVTLRIHVQTTGEGLSPQEATPLILPPNGEEIQVRTLPETNEHDLVDVKQDDNGLHLQFNHVGTVALNAVTAQNQGRILVLLIDGRVLYAPIIDEQINNGHLDVPRHIDAQTLGFLQEMVRRNLQQAART